MLHDMMLGIAATITPINLLFCLIGTLLGTLVGVLPGIGPITTIALLLPVTFGLPPLAALIMLAGIYYGSQYGGSTTAILVNLPGEASSTITVLDGYQMALQGRGGPALTVAALGSLFAGIVGTAIIMACGPTLGNLANQFSPANQFALMVLGLAAAIVLAQGSVLRATAMIMLGILLGMVGRDTESGAARLTFGLYELSDGIGFVPIAMGLFGIAEIIKNLVDRASHDSLAMPIGRLWPSREESRRAIPASVRGTIIGSILGILPGGGPTLGAFASYVVEKRISRSPQHFGHGAIEGVAGPESANNAAAQTSFIPLLVLGIPSNAVMALMMGAMIIHGIVPGPQVMTRNPELFWGLVMSMFVGNVMLVIINLPLIGIWVQILRLPYRLLYPTIMLFCCIGVYSLNSSVLEVFIMLGFSVFGYICLRLGCEPAPLLLGYVLGPLMEEAFRRAMKFSRGDLSVFVNEPLNVVMLLLAASLVLMAVLPRIRAQRETVFTE